MRKKKKTKKKKIKKKKILGGKIETDENDEVQEGKAIALELNLGVTTDKILSETVPLGAPRKMSSVSGERRGDWVQKYDPNYLRFYYGNVKTKQTTWQVPEEFANESVL